MNQPKKEVDSLEELVEGAERDLYVLSVAGNSIATEWLQKLQAAPDTLRKLSLLGDLRIAMLRDETQAAQVVTTVMFSEDNGQVNKWLSSE